MSQRIELPSENTTPIESNVPQWSYRWGVALTVMTFPLIWVGGLVTTYDAGMAVPDWPGTYGYNLWLYPWSTWIFGPFDLLVEHGHRLLGTIVGFLAIGLLIAASMTEKRTWMILWCWMILAAVIGQGVLGGFRVLLDERVMAMIHGCTGPGFFALATATSVMLSQWWRIEAPTSSLSVRLPLFLVGFLVAAAFCQLVVGAQLRHIQPWAGPRFFMMWVHGHLTLAALVTILIFWVAFRVMRQKGGVSPRISRPAGLLVCLVVFQLCLGMGTWISNYALPWPELTAGLARYVIQAKGFTESWIVTAHQATGSLIIAVSTLLALRVGRLNHCSNR